ncbi:hypothetical protein QM012_003799 [Aureobasidium pullulans]|uniref:Uncharacterized protein n=1 Tax=Aureobasidium pullulans TaxID=5580 RepID=A0ABR0T7Z2_AURPU
MIDFWRNGKPEEAESLAHQLLSFGNLPVLYRAYSHIVLAQGLEDCLFHAQKAVDKAQWGLEKYGDDKCLTLPSKYLQKPKRLKPSLPKRMMKMKQSRRKR